MPVIYSDDMKKITLYFVLIVVASWALTGCQGRNWDTDDELMVITNNWASEYVSKVMDCFLRNDTVIKAEYGSVSVTVSNKDTLKLDFRWLSDKEKGDSVNIHSSLVEVTDWVAVIVDGYRYSDEFWAHLYTTEPGIINFEGKLRIDFYEIGKTTPWAWSETTFEKAAESHYKPYKRNDYPEVGRY